MKDRKSTIKKDAFNFYVSYYEAGKHLKDKDRLAFYDAVIEYSRTGELQDELNGVAKEAFQSIKSLIDRQLTNYKNGSKLKTQKTEWVY